MRSLKIILAVVAGTVMLIYSGVKDYLLLQSNPEVHSVTIEEFIEERPTQDWVEVTGGYWDLMDAVNIYVEGKEDEPTQKVYAPYRASGDDYEDPIYLLVTTRDEEMVSFYNSFLEVSEDDTETFIIDNADALWPELPAEGILKLGSDVGELKEDGLYDQLKELYPTIENDFYVLGEGEVPSMTNAIAKILGGLGLGGGAGAFTLRKRSGGNDSQSKLEDDWQ